MSLLNKIWLRLLKSDVITAYNKKNIFHIGSKSYIIVPLFTGSIDCRNMNSDQSGLHMVPWVNFIQFLCLSEVTATSLFWNSVWDGRARVAPFYMRDFSDYKNNLELLTVSLIVISVTYWIYLTCSVLIDIFGTCFKLISRIVTCLIGACCFVTKTFESWCLHWFNKSLLLSSKKIEKHWL